jgi:ABC-type transport system involved in cytochrome bd biosynthesis fused ATPase/permease subunit
VIIVWEILGKVLSEYGLIAMLLLTVLFGCGWLIKWVFNKNDEREKRMATESAEREARLVVEAASREQRLLEVIHKQTEAIQKQNEAWDHHTEQAKEYHSKSSFALEQIKDALRIITDLLTAKGN